MITGLLVPDSGYGEATGAGAWSVLSNVCSFQRDLEQGEEVNKL